MSLSSDYQRQFTWRAWPRIFDTLPPIRGQTVLDLGCGVGDQAAELVTRGARVIGVDMNEELLHEALSRRIRTWSTPGEPGSTARRSYATSAARTSSASGRISSAA